MGEPPGYTLFPYSTLFFFNDTATTEIYTLSLHDALPICDDRELISGIVEHLGPTVYVSIDLDALDPALMPAVGTPEPGGLSWYQMVSLLRCVAETRRIVGFDITELCPAEGPAACSYTAAKLVYKLVAYATSLGK